MYFRSVFYAFLFCIRYKNTNYFYNCNKKDFFKKVFFLLNARGDFSILLKQELSFSIRVSMIIVGNGRDAVDT